MIEVGTVVHADAVAAVPWKNGGGVTRHLIGEPAGDAWRWRVSLADIDRDGPFSAYPGVERWFAVVSGAGVRLGFGPREIAIGASDEAIRFDGADAPGCSLIDGRTRDLNLMLRDGTRGWMQRARPDAAWWTQWPLTLHFDCGSLTLRVLPPLPLAGEGWGEGSSGPTHPHPNPLPPCGRGSSGLWIGIAP